MIASADGGVQPVRGGVEGFWLSSLPGRGRRHGTLHGSLWWRLRPRPRAPVSRCRWAVARRGESAERPGRWFGGMGRLGWGIHGRWSRLDGGCGGSGMGAGRGIAGVGAESLEGVDEQLVANMGWQAELTSRSWRAGVDGRELSGRGWLGCEGTNLKALLSPEASRRPWKGPQGESGSKCSCGPGLADLAGSWGPLAESAAAGSGGSGN